VNSYTFVPQVNQLCAFFAFVTSNHSYSTEQFLRNIYENFQQDTALANAAKNSVPTVQAIFDEQIMVITLAGCESV
jgi:hypothetical protein